VLPEFAGLGRSHMLDSDGKGGFADSISVPAREGYARRNNASTSGLMGTAATAICECSAARVPGWGACACGGELELELIQSHMAQKPVLRGEVGCACVAREVSVGVRGGSVWREEVGAGAGVQGAWVGGCGCEAD